MMAMVLRAAVEGERLLRISVGSQADSPGDGWDKGESTCVLLLRVVRAADATATLLTEAKGEGPS